MSGEIFCAANTSLNLSTLTRMVSRVRVFNNSGSSDKVDVLGSFPKNNGRVPLSPAQAKFKPVTFVLP